MSLPSFAEVAVPTRAASGGPAVLGQASTLPNTNPGGKVCGTARGGATRGGTRGRIVVGFAPPGRWVSDFEGRAGTYGVPRFSARPERSEPTHGQGSAERHAEQGLRASGGPDRLGRGMDFI